MKCQIINRSSMNIRSQTPNIHGETQNSVIPSTYESRKFYGKIMFSNQDIMRDKPWLMPN